MTKEQFEEKLQMRAKETSKKSRAGLQPSKPTLTEQQLLSISLRDNPDIKKSFNRKPYYMMSQGKKYSTSKG